MMKSFKGENRLNGVGVEEKINPSLKKIKYFDEKKSENKLPTENKVTKEIKAQNKFKNEIKAQNKALEKNTTENKTSENEIKSENNALEKIAAKNKAEKIKAQNESKNEIKAQNKALEEIPFENLKENKEKSPKKNLTFRDLGVAEEICTVCDQLGFKTPTEIQSQAIPQAIKGGDIIGIAETGSGKTAAFAIPILQALLDKPSIFFALVLAPTRELAIQIKEQFESLGSEIGVKCATLIGGMDMVQQAIQLAQKPNVVIATPGRILDHLENTKGFSLRSIKYLVFDEADRLLNMDFEKEMISILRIIPSDRHTFLYSATMTKKVAKLKRACLKNPIKVEVNRKYHTVKTLRQEYIFVPAKFRDVYTVALVNDLAGKLIMIFTNTIKNTFKIESILKSLGFAAIGLHGKMPQEKRINALNQFKAGKSDILVATDVASRGLDIPDVNVVLNYDIPQKSKDYIHRVGRTARAGKSGLSIAVVTQYDVELFQRIEKLIGFKLKEYQTKQEEVMLFLERVNDAQRQALIELKEKELKSKKRKRNNRR